MVSHIFLHYRAAIHVSSAHLKYYGVSELVERNNSTAYRSDCRGNVVMAVNNRLYVNLSLKFRVARKSTSWCKVKGQRWQYA